MREIRRVNHVAVLCRPREDRCITCRGGGVNDRGKEVADIYVERMTLKKNWYYRGNGIR